MPKTASPRPPDPWAPLPPLQIESWDKPLKAAFSIFAPQALWIASAERPVSVALLAPHKTEPADPGRMGHNSGSVRAVWGMKVEAWIGGNPLRWRDPRNERDRPDHVEHKGCWPMLMGLTGSQKDQITPRLPKDPYGVKWALRRRIWTLGLDRSDDAWKLKDLVTAMLQQAIAQAPNRTRLPEPYLDAGWLFEEERREGKQYWFEEHGVLPAAKELGIKVWSEDGLRRFLAAGIARSKAAHKGRAREMFGEVCADMLKEEVEAEANRPALQRPQLTALGEPLQEPARRVSDDRVRGWQTKEMPQRDLEAYRRWLDEMGAMKLSGE